MTISIRNLCHGSRPIRATLALGLLLTWLTLSTSPLTAQTLPEPGIAQNKDRIVAIPSSKETGGKFLVEKRGHRGEFSRTVESCEVVIKTEEYLRFCVFSEFATGEQAAKARSVGQIEEIYIGSIKSPSTELLAALLKEIEVRQLEIGMTKDFSDAHLSVLKQAKRITSVSLFGLEEVSDQGIEALAAVPGLEKVRISGCRKLGDETCQALSHFTELQDLDFHSQMVTAKCLEYLGACDALVSLAIGGPNDLANGVGFLSTCTKLKSLELRCKSLAEMGVSSLGQLVGLTKISLTYVQTLSAAAMKSWSKLKNLQMIVLEQCGSLDTESLTEIAALSAIVSLTFRDCPDLDDKGLICIASSKSLDQLAIYSCKSVSKAAVAELQKSRPELEVVFWND